MGEATTGAIRPGEILRLSDFLCRAGIKRHGWRQMRREAAKRGIELDYAIGRVTFVRTDGFVELLNSRPRRRPIGPMAQSDIGCDEPRTAVPR